MTAKTTVTFTSKPEKPRNPCSNAVWGDRVESCFAIPPSAALRPVATTTPWAAPFLTTVPMYAHEASSRADPVSAAGCAVFSAGTDSPVKADSSHSRSCTSSRRRSAGTMLPTASSTTSPGTRSATGTGVSLPSRKAVASRRTRARKSATACSERYSLMKLKPTLSAMIARMMSASERSPRKKARTAVDTRRIRNGFASCRSRISNAVVRGASTAFGPNVSSLRRASSPARPTTDESSRRSASSGSSEAAVVRSSDAITTLPAIPHRGPFRCPLPVYSPGRGRWLRLATSFAGTRCVSSWPDENI